MWGFLSAIFNKIASAAVTVLVAVGLFSAPLPPVSEAPATATSSPEAVQEIVLEQPVKSEKSKPALPKVVKSEKSESEEKLAQTAQLLETLKKASPPAPAPTPTPALSLPAGTFRLPNGALVDANGNILQPAPSANVSSQVTPSTPPPSPTSENYAFGSTIQIARSALAAIEYNPSLDCESLGLYLSDIKKCKLYRTDKSNYNWEIVD